MGSTITKHLYDITEDLVIGSVYDERTPEQESVFYTSYDEYQGIDMSKHASWGTVDHVQGEWPFASTSRVCEQPFALVGQSCQGEETKELTEPKYPVPRFVGPLRRRLTSIHKSIHAQILGIYMKQSQDDCTLPV